METLDTFCDPIRALALAIAQEGKPYLWDAKGPDAFDCSGLITWCIAQVGGPDWRLTHNARHLFDALEPYGSGAPGTLAFYGPSRRQVGHVMFAVGDGRVFGACGGGDNSCTTLEISKARGACVMFRPKVDYRKARDFLGYRRLQHRVSLDTGGLPNA